LAVEQCVQILNDWGWGAKIGTRAGFTYPAIRHEKWTAALEWDSGIGRTCGGFRNIGVPHWDWYLANNLEMFQVEYAGGTPVGSLLDNPYNPKGMAYALYLILLDPCRIPKARCTIGFSCPECTNKWSEKLISPISSFFGSGPFKKLEMSVNSVEKDGFNPELMLATFAIPLGSLPKIKEQVNWNLVSSE
jgi:hypothetical protein